MLFFAMGPVFVQRAPALVANVRLVAAAERQIVTSFLGQSHNAVKLTGGGGGGALDAAREALMWCASDDGVGAEHGRARRGRRRARARLPDVGCAAPRRSCATRVAVVACVRADVHDAAEHNALGGVLLPALETFSNKDHVPKRRCSNSVSRKRVSSSSTKF